MSILLLQLAFLLSSGPGHFLTEISYTSHGIIATDDRSSALYLIKDNSVSKLFSRASGGRFYAISQDKRYAGFKMIRSDGKQIPAIYDLESGSITYLYEPVFQAGQPSFSNDGKIGFTIGQDYIVRNGEITEIYPLGVHSNICPLAPGGEFAVFNDDHDQLWLLDFRTEERSCFTDCKAGYWGPRWSPDSKYIAYSTLAGEIKVYDLAEELTYDVGTGAAYEWSGNSEYIVYHVTETDGHTLTGSELYLSRFDASIQNRLTHTDDIFEMEPSFADDRHIIFRTDGRNEICTAEVVNGEMKDLKIAYGSTQGLNVEYRYPVCDFGTRDSIDVPYIHQVYDTPDWHNGHWSCAPTTAMMAIAYYRRLPYWDCWCSSPYGHTSHFGNYICSIYNFWEHTYDLVAQDAGGYDAWGGYGYMWYNGYSPYSRMMNYLTYHDLTSWNDDSPTWAETVAEVQAGWPYCMCVGLTTAGHLVLAVGQVSDWHTLIFNDPYGNKNTPGYPSYDGKYARYDWPGYYNGYENLNTVYWCRGARGDWEPQPDTIVDDLQYQYTGEPHGFYMFNISPSTQRYFHDNLSGYNGHMWWTYTTVSVDTCYVTWTPDLPASGNYEVLAYVPGVNANANARYQIHYNGGTNTVIVNQADYSSQWVSLGIFPFNVTGGHVYLGDATGTSGQHIAFDAMRWSSYNPAVTENYHTSKNRMRLATTVVRNNAVLLLQDQDCTQIEYSVFDITGKRILQDRKTIANGDQHIIIGTSHLPAGIYFLRASSLGQNHEVKFIKLR